MSDKIVRPCLLSDLFHVFSAPRRCYAIQLLSHNLREDYPVRELAREITSIEQGISKEDATGEPYRNVYNALSQSHLKLMSKNDLINYNKQRQIVVPTQYINKIELMLEFNWMTYLLLCGCSIPTDHNICII